MHLRLRLSICPRQKSSRSRTQKFQEMNLRLSLRKRINTRFKSLQRDITKFKGSKSLRSTYKKRSSNPRTRRKSFMSVRTNCTVRFIKSSVGVGRRPLTTQQLLHNRVSKKQVMMRRSLKEQQQQANKRPAEVLQGRLLQLMPVINQLCQFDRDV